MHYTQDSKEKTKADPDYGNINEDIKPIGLTFLGTSGLDK